MTTFLKALCVTALLFLLALAGVWVVQYKLAVLTVAFLAIFLPVWGVLWTDARDKRVRPPS